MTAWMRTGTSEEYGRRGGANIKEGREYTWKRREYVEYGQGEGHECGRQFLKVWDGEQAEKEGSNTRRRRRKGKEKLQSKWK